MNEMIFLGGCPVIRPEGIYVNGVRVISLGLGAVQRQNPLPAGRYWIDIFDKDSDAFGAWLSSNKATVVVRATEHFESTPTRDWYLFEVKVPTPWQGPGFPTIATPDVTTSSDTAQRPDAPPSITDQIEQLLASEKSVLKTTVWIGVAVAAVVGGALLYKHGAKTA